MYTTGQRVIWYQPNQSEYKYKHAVVCRPGIEQTTIKIFDPHYGEWYYRKVPTSQLRETPYPPVTVKEIER